MFIAHNALVHIHNDTMKEGKRNHTNDEKQISKSWSSRKKGARKKRKERIKLKREKRTRANNKATLMKPDDVCAYSLRFYAKRISRLVPLLAYWFHCRQFFFQSHLSSSSILSRHLTIVHSYKKIMHTIAANECASFSK